MEQQLLEWEQQTRLLMQVIQIALITDDLFADAQLNAMFSKNIDANGVPYWNIPNGWSIVIALPVVVTVAKEMNFFCLRRRILIINYTK